MNNNVEFCMVVRNSLEALELYKRVFEIETVEVSNFGAGFSECVFNIFGTRFHLLDENPEHMLIAPKEGDPRSSWINVNVTDIAATFEKALEAGCQQITPINDMPQMGMKNAIFADEFGYMWMLHQVYKVVSHEERMEIFRKSQENA